MPADDFVKLVSGPTVLGDPDLKTQHFIGASKWDRISEDEVVGYHQLRVPHQKKTKMVKQTENDKSGKNGMRYYSSLRWYTMHIRERKKMRSVARDENLETILKNKKSSYRFGV